ncbi:hypothetical protein TWF569_006359 [Orbilia oligospora]|uniref:Uncharacterized protein n=1 Tax=Orbilia oligospora TaxID=2813651 RepID=A0A7C8NIN1_ORBOL|nr:hypothetical protein TWF102_011878 [Orbilia oligospora]KAF3084572.1 hypothetical protein TWF102_011878 [Orbilia oligospora]KAF3100460.1 hypothetical protein TWF103_008190 [Orbilia oligospora]KAF3110903.1 hypothetical protein TWF706_000370 [Orbilia oligospora]KAF3139038.1 hypothetical protein TWF594_006794 [Orbilia oligospora]
MSSGSPPTAATNDPAAPPFPIPTLILTKLSVPSESYDSEPSNAIIINLSLQPSVLVTCFTLSGHELGYFGWDSGAVDIIFESDSDVVINYSATPTIWSSGQRIPETKQYLAERSWFHTFANVVSRSCSDGSGTMKLSVKSLAEHGHGEGGVMEGGTEGGLVSQHILEGVSGSPPARIPKMTPRSGKRVIRGRVSKIGKVKRSSMDSAEALRKLLNPLEKLKI